MTTALTIKKRESDSDRMLQYTKSVLDSGTAIFRSMVENKILSATMAIVLVEYLQKQYRTVRVNVTGGYYMESVPVIPDFIGSALEGAIIAGLSEKTVEAVSEGFTGFLTTLAGIFAK